MEHPCGDAPASPAQRACVVQGHATADLAQGQVIGRVEQVLSGQATRCVTLDALLSRWTQCFAYPTLLENQSYSPYQYV